MTTELIIKNEFEKIIAERQAALNRVEEIRILRASQRMFTSAQKKELKHISDTYCPGVPADPRSLRIALNQSIKSLETYLDYYTESCTPKTLLHVV